MEITMPPANAVAYPMPLHAPAERCTSSAVGINALLLGADPRDRIAFIRQGIPASSVADLADRMGASKEFIITSLGLCSVAISRKEREGAPLSRDESERLLGIDRLIGIVQIMVRESGNPEGFNAAGWVFDWLVQPLPALGGATPASYMDTFEGQQLIGEMLRFSQSGAYA
jgi:uncharacterized protein (DUF2384 family)